VRTKSIPFQYYYYTSLHTCASSFIYNIIYGVCFARVRSQGRFFTRVETGQVLFRRCHIACELRVLHKEQKFYRSTTQLWIINNCARACAICILYQIVQTVHFKIGWDYIIILLYYYYYRLPVIVWRTVCPIMYIVHNIIYLKFC